MKRSVHDAIYFIQTNEGIELSESSRQAIEAVDKQAHRERDRSFELYKNDLPKIKHYNELRLWAIRNDDQRLLALINQLESGESIR